MNRTQVFLAALAFSGTLVLNACGGGGGGSGGGGGNNFTPPTPTPTPISVAGFSCPSSTSSFAVATNGRGASSEAQYRYPRRTRATASASALTVTYTASRASMVEPAIDAQLGSFAARKTSALNFDRLGTVARVVSVDQAHEAGLRAALSSTPGVVSVTAAQRLYAKRVTTPFLTNDPYFSSQAQASAPLYETATIPGQWDMHVIGMEYAYGYSQSGNGSGITNSSALGSSSVRLAVIDTGMDVTHPDLASAHIARTQCFITDTSDIQSTGNFVTDPDGHGTDVTGIAAAGVNNGFGFTGAGGKISLMLYRVFPTPDDTCFDPNTTSPNCGAADVDVASAINDAVANGANVITMSLGGGSCTSGQDPSSIEGAAVANAIAHNVIVVSASGNENASSPDAPGCDPGVISVGASAYNDGQPNGTGYTGTNHEYVATSYSNLGATLVAPGGDPGAGTDNDDLHWIENIYTSTPLDSMYAGACNVDFYNVLGDCRILIAGTSMSTPHVAGAAALVLSVNAAYQSPAAMKQLLCQSADNINDANQGCGRLNVNRAMAMALNDPVLP